MTGLTEAEAITLSAAVSAVVGAVVALVAVFLTNRANAKSAKTTRDHELHLRRQDLLRSRGEELYTLFELWLNRLVGYYFVKCSIMSGKLTYNQALDLEIKNNSEVKGDHVRIEMLIDVYFPELRGEYDAVIESRERANDIVLQHKSHYTTVSTDGRAFRNKLLKEQNKLNEQAAQFKSRLLSALRNA